MWIIIQLRLQINSLLMISEDSALFLVKQLQCIIFGFERHPFVHLM